MTELFGNLVVILFLAAVVGLAVRSLWRTHRQGGCTGDCEHCGGCGRKPERPASSHR